MTAGTSRWALNLGSVGGVPIRVHLTFFLLVAWVAIDAKSYGAHPAQEVLFVCALFFCILLHELGHALVAKRFGIRTSDIVLYPFGGVASLSNQVRPAAEFWIALAGPIVNLMIAAILLQFTSVPLGTLDSEVTAEALLASQSISDRLIVGNLVLFIFNLIPAFPMDGGRVLRSALAMLGVRSATVIASRMSQILSVLLAVAGVYGGNPILLIISVFVFSAASRELTFAPREARVSKLKVKDVMIESPHLTVLSHGLSAKAAIPAILKSLQEYFPVLHGSAVLGIVSKEDILLSAGVDEEEQYIAGLANREFASIPPSMPLVDASELIYASGGAPLLVMEGESLCGLLTKEAALDGIVWTKVTQDLEKVRA